MVKVDSLAESTVMVMPPALQAGWDSRMVSWKMRRPREAVVHTPAEKSKVPTPGDTHARA
jgi:hypothetical protein